MNIYLAIIIGSILAAYILNAFASHLNLKALAPEVPEEFKGGLDPEKYRKSQEYARANARFDNVSDTAMTALTIAFILLGGFNILDQQVRTLGLSMIPSGLIFFAALGFLADMASLPFDLYRTFVLEEKFGFNTTTPGLYLLDKIKGYILAAIIGGLVLGAILWFFQAVGDSAWLWCWLFTVLTTLILTYVAPVWILPLFNKFTPLEEGKLRTAIEDYAQKIGFKLGGVFVMDGSKRSKKANAFFTGLGSKKRIALFDTLIEKQTTGEIVAVLAHEAGHQKLGHIKKGLAMSIVKTGAIFYLMSFFLNSKGLFAAFGMEEMSIYAGLIFFGLLYSPVSMVLSILANHISRKHEFEADAFSVRTTADPESMASALKKLSAANLSNLTPHWLTVRLHYTHPPVLERIKAIRNSA